MKLDRCMPALVAALCFAVLGGGPVLAHNLAEERPLEQAERATSSGDDVETMTGTVHELVIDDALHRTSSRHVELRLDDGTLVPLRGNAAAALADGARVEVSGRRNGSPLGVEAARTIAPTSAGAVGKASTDVEGTFAVLHADDFAGGRSAYMYEVHQASGKVNRLHVASLPSTLVPGMRVRVVGRAEADGESMTPDRITILAAPASSADAMTTKAATANSVLVVMANFSNTVAPSFTPAQAQQVMTSNADSVANFFRETSYGQQVMNVTVTPGWVTMNLAQPATCGSTDWRAIGTYADAAARTLGAAYDPAVYNFVVYLFPKVAACGWTGLAYIETPHKAWVNGAAAFRTSTIAHEMGHNFGLLHAASLRCGSDVIGGSCSVSEYGDPFDAMGNQRAMHYNAMQKLKLAWIASASVKTHAGGSVTYTLSPLEVAGASTYAVRIPTTSANRTYWLEFRQSIGFDSPLSAFANNGAQIRVASPFETLCAGCDSYSDDTQLLDMTPSTTAFTDATLPAGQTFSDVTYGIRVTVLSATASAMTVQVATSGTSPTPAGNPAPLSASATSLDFPATSVNSVSAARTITLVNVDTSPITVSGITVAGPFIQTSDCGTLASGAKCTISVTFSPSAAGSASGALGVSYGGAGSPLSITLTGFGTISLVDHYYQTILGRAPDAAGKTYWEGEAARMQSLGVDVKEAYMAMAGYFFNSPEYTSLGTSDTRYVSDLYNTFFDRAPDAGGLAYWTGQLAQGLPRNIVLYGFLFSPEFNSFMTGLFGSTTSRAEVYAVVDFYRGLLNRLPDTQGFNYWLGQFRAAQCSGTNAAGAIYAASDSISSQFISSAEYIGRRRSNAEYVSDLYYAFLRRGGDLAGVNYWINRLDTAAEDRQAMRRDFLNATEFGERLKAIVAQGC